MKYYKLFKEGKLFDQNEPNFIFMNFGNFPIGTKSKITEEKLKNAIFCSSFPIWKSLGYKNSDGFSRAMRKIFPSKDNLKKE